jgi:hypothetical protein
LNSENLRYGRWWSIICNRAGKRFGYGLTVGVLVKAIDDYLVDQRRPDEEGDKLTPVGLTRFGRPEREVDRLTLCEVAERLLKEDTKAYDPPPETRPCIHARDFCWVRWYGQEHEFNPTQAACVRLLWKAWEAEPSSGLHQATILEDPDVESQCQRLRDVFRSRGDQHLAWDTMIQCGDTGICRLVPPQS